MRLVWISGNSDPRSCALSESQVALLATLPLPEAAKVYANFPYDREGTSARVPPLLLASLSNFAQFVLASTPLYAWRMGAHWRAICADTDHLLVVAGSCGAQIVRALEPATPRGTRISVLALGPTAWRRPRSEHAFVQDRRDWFSRLFFRVADSSKDLRVDRVGHMGYLHSEEVLAHIRAWVAAQSAAGAREDPSCRPSAGDDWRFGLPPGGGRTARTAR